MAYTQEQINAALVAELNARPGTKAYDLADYAMQTYGITPEQINAAYKALDVTAVPETVDYEYNYGTSPLYTKPADYVGFTGPSQTVVNPATGKVTQLTFNAPGFDPNDPYTLERLGELVWDGSDNNGRRWYDNYATPAQKAAADSLWEADWKRRNASDIAKGTPGAIPGGVMPKNRQEEIRINSALVDKWERENKVYNPFETAAYNAFQSNDVAALNRAIQDGQLTRAKVQLSFGLSDADAEYLIEKNGVKFFEPTADTSGLLSGTTIAGTLASTTTGNLSGTTTGITNVTNLKTGTTALTGLLTGQPIATTATPIPIAQQDSGTTRQAMSQAAPNKSAVPAGFIEGLTAIPNVTDRQIISAMKAANVSPKNLADGLGIAEGEVIARVAATVPYGSTIQLGDTIVQPVYQVTGSGQDQQIGAIESVYSYRTSDNKPGGGYTQYAADGTFQKTGTQVKVNATKDFVKFALTAGALFGGAALAGLGPLAQTAGITAAEAAGLGLTATEAAGLGFTSTQLAAAGYTAADIAAAGLTTTAVTTGLTTVAGTTVADVATGLTASQLATAARLGLTAVQFANLIASGGQTVAGLLQQETSREAAVKAQAMIDAETTAAKAAAAFKPIGMTTRFGTSEFKTDPVTGQLTSAGYTLSPEAKYAQDFFRTQSNLGLQQVELAPAVYAPLKTGANMMFDLGQQALNQPTDARLGQIATDYLTQSAGSKALQTLGEKYIAQSPEEVAQNYLNQQMALLQPGRELELANLQNKLQQQGRGGLAVAQGGALGATTPELQALYNARATQEAQLAAGAQQAGQQQVQFGAGLFGTGQQLGMQGQQFGMDTLAKQQALDQQRIGFGAGLYGTGAQTLGNYYGGLAQSYAPYNAAFGQMQALEAAGQQPLTLAAGLGQTASTAGARVGQLGLMGAEQSVALATGKAATTNPYATALGGVTSNPLFTDAIVKLAGGTSVNALDFGAYGSGNTGFQKMIDDIYGRG
jgi:hypothetical protein